MPGKIGAIHTQIITKPGRGTSTVPLIRLLSSVILGTVRNEAAARQSPLFYLLAIVVLLTSLKTLTLRKCCMAAAQ